MKIYVFVVDNRWDNVYAFHRPEDRDDFAQAIRDEGGDGVAHDVPVNGTSDTRFLMEAERT